MIQDKDISIVIQGPVIYNSDLQAVDETTRLVCNRARQLFPESELILSTWEGENVHGIPYDQCIFNQDPGATWFNYKNYSLLNNCNRMIVSTQGGIKAASRKYTLKIRSDLFIISKKFLNYFYKYPLFNKRYQFVKNRILAFSIYSIKGHQTSLFTMERPYHISDWAYFGYTEDLQDLYDIPLTKEPEFSQWFLHRCKDFYDIEPGRLWKMPPEQYITSSFLAKKIRINLDHTNDVSNTNMQMSEKLLVNNFLVLDQSQFSLISLKYFKLQILFDPLLRNTAIHYHCWLDDYTAYCANSMVDKVKYKLIIYWRKSVYFVLNRCLTSNKITINWLPKIIACLIKRWWHNKAKCRLGHDTTSDYK